MARSSWHCFWIIMTVEMWATCGIFALVVFGSQHVAEGSAMASNVGLSQLVIAKLASDLAALFMFFFGFLGMISGSAWAACVMSFREKRAFEQWQRVKVAAAEKRGNVEGVDVTL